ncbi:MAG: hypothetical protein R3E39_20465 [Anaerolineae bacterium]
MDIYPPYRHWHGPSEKYAGGDSLLSALAGGWKIQQVNLQVYQLGGTRRSMVYHVGLQRLSQVVVMLVISNPFVMQLLSNFAGADQDMNWSVIGGENHVEKTPAEDKAHLQSNFHPPRVDQS